MNSSRPHLPSQKPCRHARGFTLIEVMIAVAIVGILSAIAYPSYTEYVLRSHRSSAKNGLLQAAQWMERAATATGQYPDELPAALKTLEGDPDGKRYEIELDFEDDSYVLTATAKGAQLKDKCGNLELTGSGRKNSSSGNAQDCWGR